MALRASLSRVGAWALLRSGALSLRRGRYERGRAILLLYHRVNDEGDPFLPALPLKHFRAQLDYLAHCYRVDPLDTVLDWLASGAPGPARVALTFDDGYPDTAECVLPELARRGIPATLFLSTGPPETGVPLWTDRTRWLLKHARVPVLELPGLGLPRLPLEPLPARLRTLEVLLAHMKRLPRAELDASLETLERHLDKAGSGPRVLSWDDARRIAAGPVRIGAHTHRHYVLSRLDDTTLRSEIETSVRLIEERLGERVNAFAYPNGTAGDYDERPGRILGQLGVRCSLTAQHGFARPGDDPFQLPRIFTTDPFLASFAARVAGLAGRRDGDS